MALTIGGAVVLGLFGLVGLLRGVRRGVVALAGTLLAAVLVDLWQERWAAWLRETVRPERPGLPTFLLVASIFVGVALLIGYGGSALLPRSAPGTKGPGLLDRPLGALVGALNGALVLSYLLRYATELWSDESLAAAVAGSRVAGVLDAWLPWFILALVGTTAVFVILRTTVRVGRALSTRPAQATPAGQAATKPADKPAATPAASAGGASVAGAPNLKESDQRLSGKIDQALGNDRR